MEDQPTKPLPDQQPVEPGKAPQEPVPAGDPVTPTRETPRMIRE